MKKLFLGILLYMLSTVSFASGDNININNNFYDVTEINEITRALDDDFVDELIAKSAACDHSFYWGKEATWMISPQVAYYHSELEVCIGAAYRPRNTSVMFNISIVPDEDTDEIIWQGGALIVLD